MSRPGDLCQDVDAAGKNLTVGAHQGGLSAQKCHLSGSGGSVSFGPDQPYAIGKANVVVLMTLGPVSWCLLVADDLEILGPVTGGRHGWPFGASIESS